MATPTRGRPRDQAIDAAILEAARALMLEVGYAGLMMDAVAARAGISKPTLYRRYPNKGALVVEVAFGDVPSVEPPDTGDVQADFLTAYQFGVAHIAVPLGRETFLALFAEFAEKSDVGNPLRDNVIEPTFVRLLALLRQAQERGEIREDVDLQLVLEACLGTVLARLALDRPIDDAYCAELVDLLIAGLAPRRQS